MKYKIQPFVKWVGGKRQLLDRIKDRIPSDFNSYYEPFVGGGALFIDLQNSQTIINDFSTELTDAYITIRDFPHDLMKLLDKHEEKHLKSPSEYFYNIREQDRRENWKKKNALEKTARFIYLNKSCFNGMYRVNKKGYYNVPFGKKDKINSYNKENILSLSDYLNNNSVKILNGDFEEAVSTAKKGDFIFFDPPYDLINKDTFDSYTKNGFGVEGQKRLSELAHKLHNKGCYVMITNHNTPLINELYSDFNIDVVSVKRMINSDASNRKGVETIIYNYDLEEKKMKQLFEDLLSNLKDTVADYKYYTNFPKVYKHVDKIKVELNILNSLIGSDDIEKDFISVINEYPKTLKVIPLLLAIRKNGNKVPIIDEVPIMFEFNNRSLSDEMYIRFMRESGLFNLLESSKIRNLFDYVTGVEVGLDTNARKNRTGTAMENIVESYIQKTNHIEYSTETNKKDIKEMYNIDLDEYLTSKESLKIAEKRFDFVIKTSNQVFVVETNFYSGGGSKLNETARSFKSLGLDIKNNKELTFIWITDGVGWKTAKNNLREAYDVLDHLYTLTDLENGVLNKIIK